MNEVLSYFSAGVHNLLKEVKSLLIPNALFICAKAKRQQQLCRGIIDLVLCFVNGVVIVFKLFTKHLRVL
ncbi:hypothetical protein [Lysinibacillus sp. JNUCC 51]|uniref:hypothetical protein n=1 Tax=Lysinibacillus sp. JNUCC-51 TaxID=2792479 RepID=UPI001936DEBD|nr:hypothetical protein JNUCC51_04785 [Lysinibacillus sp. JNUCC-51]